MNSKELLNRAMEVLNFDRFLMAEALGVSERTVRRWSNGEVAIPASVVVLCKLALQGVWSGGKDAADILV